nr:Gag-Pol polyprotein [Tanacetum cinerariifolium]
MKEKGDECIFVGYSTQSRAYRVFNKRTRVIMESIHVNFDELPQMASVQNSSDPGPTRQSMASAHNSSDPAPTCQTMASIQISSNPVPKCQTMALEHNSLSPRRNCQENVSHGDKTGTTSNELDLLFSPMFDELLNGSTKVVSKSSACQPIDQNVDFSGSEQIQTTQYPDVHPPSQEISDEVFQAKGDLMKSIKTFLEEFNYIPFGEKPKILLEAWDKIFTIQRAQPEDSNELFQKLLEDLKELAEYKESLENSSIETAASNSNQEKEEPPQDSDIHQLIREECCTEVKSDEIIKSGVEELVLILSKNEVTSEDKRKSDMPVCENSPICDNHSEIFSDSKNDDDISSDDDDLEDIEYVEASLPYPKIVSLEEENVVYQEEEEVDLEDISQIQDVDLREKLLSINRLIAN